MAENNAPNIRVLGFKTTYERHPKRGTNPLDDKTDLKGFLLDAAGNRVMEVVAEDWVVYAPAHSPLNTQNTERVRHMRPDPDKVGTDNDGAKLAFMLSRWSQIEPAYDAWKKGQELPVNGTPLSVWPAVNEEQVKVFRTVGIVTIEEVRDLSESQIGRVPLPNMRELKAQAALFLENAGASEAAEREAAKDATIDAMSVRLAQLEALLENQGAPQDAKVVGETGGEEVDELRAQLDAKGIDYDRRWAAPKLRQALQAEAA